MKYLLHVDGKFPNLALMKLATYFKERQEAVRLVRDGGPQLWDEPGEVFGSSIFEFSGPKRKIMEEAWGKVRWGGTGVSLASSLREIDPGVDWDTVKPDYSLYPTFQNSIGFTQRGCRLSCKFCVVPEKEGRPKSVNTIWDIYRGDNFPRRALLLDNDFFGQPREEWKARLQEIREGAFRVAFCQGINIRQMDEETSAALAATEYWDNEFERRRIYTAWDNVKEEAAFRRGLETLVTAGIPAKRIMVYMLVGYAKGETWAEILHRFHTITDLGCMAYPMVYDNLDPKLKAFQRWACRGLYKAVPWEKYIDPRLGNGSNKGLKIA